MPTDDFLFHKLNLSYLQEVISLFPPLFSLSEKNIQSWLKPKIGPPETLDEIATKVQNFFRAQVEVELVTLGSKLTLGERLTKVDYLLDTFSSHSIKSLTTAFYFASRYGFLNRSILTKAETERLVLLQNKLRAEMRAANSYGDSWSDLITDASLKGSKNLFTSNDDLARATGALQSNFDTGFWWSHGDAFTDGNISRGLPVELYGHDFIRSYSWFARSTAREEAIKTDQVHVAKNISKSGEYLSTEILIHRNGEWEPLFFEREGHYWIQKSTIDVKASQKTIKDRCMECHISQGKGSVPLGKLSPRPLFMKTEADWRRAGFKNEDLIKQLLAF